ncbi:uncharacterized protein FIESC28_09679 [Fusarium coffeatum]|uniref:Uncharacterized protein n=1 Tax=Fusarium coffeatum TaxID=231269 RepID=A0A366QYF6_9HYPO|nr:uncharacterized protein FIESC28_09679 [Fusarium coffeatum]RBR09933.1 hypothetical protein FIESC28_09679 [Fusarium coffeatum]
MKDIQDPAVQDQCQLQVITINLIALHVGAYGALDDYSLIVEKLKKSDLREFATSVRDTIYSLTSSRPHDKEDSNGHLQGNIDELLRNSTSAFFSTLSSKGMPEQQLEPINALKDMAGLLELDIDDSADISLHLIATCGIALSQIGQVIPYNKGSSLARHCWMVLEPFNRMLHVNTSPQSRWWSSLEEIAQQRNHNNCNTWANRHITSELSDRQILEKLWDRQDVIIHRIDQVLNRTGSLDSSVKSCQNTDRHGTDQDGGQRMSIFELLAASRKEF